MFNVPGPPQGKARARTFYNPKINKMSSITPEKTVLYENLIKQCYLDSYMADKRYMDNEPLEMEITAIYDVPMSVSNKRRDRMLKSVEYPTKKPDIDNIAKVVCDALNGIAYKDDKQIVSLKLAKRYGQLPMLVIDINKVNEQID